MESIMTWHRTLKIWHIQSTPKKAKIPMRWTWIPPNDDKFHEGDLLEVNHWKWGVRFFVRLFLAAEQL
jgi:hypothetical protein